MRYWPPQSQTDQWNKDKAHICLRYVDNWFDKSEKKTQFNDKEQYFQQTVLEPLDIHIWKNKISPIPYTMYKN